MTEPKVRIGQSLENNITLGNVNFLTKRELGSSKLVPATL